MRISGNKRGVIVKDVEGMNNLYRLTDNLGTILKDYLTRENNFDKIICDRCSQKKWSKSWLKKRKNITIRRTAQVLNRRITFLKT